MLSCFSVVKEAVVLKINEFGLLLFGSLGKGRLSVLWVNRCTTIPAQSALCKYTIEEWNNLLIFTGGAIQCNYDRWLEVISHLFRRSFLHSQTIRNLFVLNFSLKKSFSFSFFLFIESFFFLLQSSLLFCLRLKHL